MAVTYNTEKKKAVLFIATPCINGWVWGGFMDSMVEAIKVLTAANIGVILHRKDGDSLVTRARNVIVSEFLATPEATHLLFIDCDIRFRGEDIVAMVNSHHADGVLCAAYPKKQDEPEFVVNFHRPPDVPVDAEGFAIARDAGTGFMMISRGVFEKTRHVVPRLYYWNLPGVGTALRTEEEWQARADNHRGWFSEGFEQVADRGKEIGDGEVVYNTLSEDYAFCRRVQSVGIPVVVYTHGELGHFGAREWRGSFSALMAPPVPVEMNEPGEWPAEEEKAVHGIAAE